MTDAPDAELLSQFARNGSEAAFAELVRRYVALVHSVALRHTSSPDHAQDITQAVFIILARKAGSLGRKTVLPGWLYHTARLTAANYRRARARRIHREQEAFMQATQEESPSDSIWRQMAPLLDDAMAPLSATDRDALVLRYFQNMSLLEVGMALGLKERAAQKRVSRALEKLRKFFSKRGVTLTTAVIAAGVSANSVHAAPAGLASAVTLGAVKGTTISATITTLVKGTMKTMTLLKLKLATGLGVAALLVGGAATVALSDDGNAAGSGGATGGGNAFQIGKVLDAPTADTETLTLSTTNRVTGEAANETLYVQRSGRLDQSAIDSVSVSQDPRGAWQVGFGLTASGKKEFARLTRESIGRRLAILVEGRVVSAPMVRAEITGGRGVISGNFSEQEARALARSISP